MPAEVEIQYRPRRVTGFGFAATWLVTAGVLVWVGVVLVPEDRAAMDGLPLLLFTVVPIRLFSWVMAGVFLVLAFAVGRRTVRARPTLTVSSSGVILPSGAKIPWAGVLSASVTRDGALEIEVESNRDAGSTRRRGAWWNRRRRRNSGNEAVTLSSFELGEAPDRVAAEMHRRMGGVSSPSGDG